MPIVHSFPEQFFLYFFAYDIAEMIETPSTLIFIISLICCVLSHQLQLREFVAIVFSSI